MHQLQVRLPSTEISSESTCIPAGVVPTPTETHLGTCSEALGPPQLVFPGLLALVLQMQGMRGWRHLRIRVSDAKGKEC